MLWGSASLAAGHGLLRHGRLTTTRRASLALCFLGIVAMAIVLSQGFSHRA